MTENLLSWITNEQVIEILRNRFGKILSNMNDRGESKGETTLDILMAFALAKSPEEIAEANQATSLTKSLQNNIGLFHQDILGSVKGWQSTGAAGGSYDIRGTSNVIQEGKDIFGEVKMRYNTIRGKDRSAIWDELNDAVKNNGNESDSVGYLMEIVPENNKPYDLEWIFTANNKNYRGEHVRRIDGVTAYHIVTGDKDAIFDLLKALPELLFQAFPHVNKNKEETLNNIRAFIEGSLERTLAKKSYYA